MNEPIFSNLTTKYDNNFCFCCKDGESIYPSDLCSNLQSICDSLGGTLRLISDGVCADPPPP